VKHLIKGLPRWKSERGTCRKMSSSCWPSEAVAGAQGQKSQEEYEQGLGSWEFTPEDLEKPCAPVQPDAELAGEAMRRGAAVGVLWRRKSSLKCCSLKM